MPREHMPPAFLEDATVAALRHSGLLGSAPSRWRPVALAASLLLMFGLGWAIRARSPVAAAPTPTFALLLYGGATEGDSAHAIRAAEYAAWAAAQHSEALVVGGEALGDPGDVVVPPFVRMMSPNIPPVGVFLVQASSAEAASRLARECPHVKYGGMVVVHPIRPT